MSNRLCNEKSLYLRQHAENPVDWYPWCEEAFAVAKRENKPVLVSIGYSACHWCHVMAHESFESEYIANLMNEHFVCIKVDREERPDVDRIYMDAVQMVTGHGGWPLNAFCFPDGRPFAGGTYFPPDDSKGMGNIPWPQLLMRVSDFYKRNRDELEDNATNILKNLQYSNNPAGDMTGEPLANTLFLGAAQRMCEGHDDQYGGFGDAPKFPPSMALNFLLEVRASTAVDLHNPTLRDRIDQVVRTTLRAMAHGGLFDQLGGGFMRYSVDKLWLIPHFEKMLYDNGLLIDAYTKGFLRYQDPLFRYVVEETIGWLEREMLDANGGFYSSLDADTEGREGMTYVWNREQVREVLGEEEGEQFCRVYCITEEGNFEENLSNPALGAPDIETREAFKQMRKKLLAARDLRPQPGKDRKQLLSWNALVIRGLAEAGFYFGKKKWFALAIRTADWVWENFRFEEDRLQSVLYDGEPSFNGYLDDYAFFAEALLSLGAKADWYEHGLGTVYCDRAKAIVASILERFADKDAPGFFFTSDDHEELVSRKKEWFDNAIPSGNSSIVHCLAGLYAISGDPLYGDQLNQLRSGYPGLVQKVHGGIPHAMAGFVSDAIGTVVIQYKGEQDLDALQSGLAAKPWRRTFILQSKDTDLPNGFSLCVGTQCLEPSQDVSEILEKI